VRALNHELGGTSKQRFKIQTKYCALGPHFPAAASVSGGVSGVLADSTVYDSEGVVVDRGGVGAVVNGGGGSLSTEQSVLAEACAWDALAIALEREDGNPLTDIF
jgi:phage-related minor tail protein